MSKGSNRRPTKVPYETFESNWERIFGNDKSRSTGRTGTVQTDTDERGRLGGEGKEGASTS